jgi:peptide/nickel transport system ATP-binding protein
MNAVAKAAADTPVICVADLCIGTSPSHAIVRDLSFTIRTGEVLGIVGESGSGKTLTAHAIAGLLPERLRPVRGSISLEGHLLEAEPTSSRRKLTANRIGMIFQDPLSSFNPVRTVGSLIIESGMRHRGLSRSDARHEAIEALAAMKLADPARLIDAYPHQLSGGQRQRAMIALARFNKPALLIADEPTTALDATVQLQILSLLKLSVAHTALMLITHDLGVAAAMCDRILVMHRGQCVEEGKTQQLLNAPRHAYTQMLLRASSLSQPARPSVKAVDTGTPILEARNVSVTFSTSGRVVHAARDCSFQLHRGEVLAIVGESAAGKSTLARVVAGIVTPSRGNVVFHSQDMRRASGVEGRTLRRRIQMVFQDPDASLNPAHRVGDILAEPLIVRAYGDRASMRRRVEDLLALVQLDISLLDKRPHELSGGQKQRVAIARALAMEPEVLIADEPLSSLDASTAASITELFRDLQSRLGIALLFISHDLAAVRRLATRVAVMYRGEIVESGPCTILDEPAHAYTRLLVAASPASNRTLDLRQRGLS